MSLDQSKKFFNFSRLKRDLENNNVKRIEYSDLKDPYNLVTLYILLFNNVGYQVVLPIQIGINLINKLKSNLPIREKRYSIFDRVKRFISNYIYYVITFPISCFLFFTLLPLFITIANGFFIVPNNDENIEQGMMQLNDNDELSLNKFIIYPKDINVDFDNIYSNKDAKEDLKIYLHLFKNDLLNNTNKIQLPSGIVLSGKPGNGKTSLAKAFAKEANVPLISVPGSFFDEVFHGTGKNRVKKIFQLARNMAPCILFIDEIDCVASKSIRDDSKYLETINQLLVELDGFFEDIKNKPAVLVMAATNDREDLDPAIVRSGRLEKDIQLFNPTFAERIGFIKNEIMQNKIPVDSGIDISELSGITVGATYAELKECINNAALSAITKRKAVVEMSDFIYGINNLYSGLVQDKSISKESKEIFALMQAAKTILFKACLEDYNIKLSYISLHNRSNLYWGDFLESIKETNANLYSSKDYLLNVIAMRLAYIVVTYDINNIDAHMNRNILFDFCYAKNLALQFLGYDFFDDEQYNFAMYDVFRKNSGISIANSLLKKLKLIPNDQKARSLDKIDSILNNERKKCKEILLKNLDTVNKLKALLIEKNEIFSEELNEFFINNPIIK